jgi:hypothetical protein
MKKQLFNKLVDQIRSNPDLYSTHKVTYKDDLEVHTFGHAGNKELTEIKKALDTHGYKIDSLSTHKISNTYLTLLYAGDKDKISISLFNSGYAYAHRKKRYYPVKQNTPVFAWTKHMYNLQPQGRGKYIPNPRIQLGSINLYGTFPQVGEIITKTLLNIDYLPQVLISYRHIMNTKNDFEAIGNMFGVNVPKALHKFYSNDVMTLYKTMKDHNQINKLCQFMAKDSGITSGPNVMIDQIVAYPMDLYQTISKMLFGNVHQNWLVRDYVVDNISLKTRNVSLKVTSLKRWQDDHRRASTMRMIQGVSEIKVDKKYNGALNGLEYPYELISSKERLVQESVELGHCVATYANKINSGLCGIFSIEYEGKRWTLEVSAGDHNGKIGYAPIQLRGLYNAQAPDLLLSKVSDILHKNSNTTLSKAALEKQIRNIEPVELLF